jgi:signal transduction histidine kinase
MLWPGAGGVFDPLPLWFALADYLLFLGIFGCLASFVFAQELLESQKNRLILLPWFIGPQFCWACAVCTILLGLNFLFIEEDLEETNDLRFFLALNLLILAGLLIAGTARQEGEHRKKVFAVISGGGWIVVGLAAFHFMSGVRSSVFDHWTAQSGWLFTLGAALLSFPSCFMAAFLFALLIRTTDCLPERYWAFRWRMAGLVLVGVGALGAAWFALAWRVETLRLQDANSLTSRVTTAALSMDMALVNQLRGLPEDEDQEWFVKLRSSLTKILHANPDVLHAYIWTIRDGMILFLADGTEDEEEYSKPGDAYGPAEPEDEKYYSWPQAYVHGPFVDDWGAFIAANAPLDDPETGRRIGWIGLDWSAKGWLQSFATARFQIFLGLLCGQLVLIGSSTWMARQEITLAGERKKVDLLQQERNRFARDLHDGLGQSLAGLSYIASALQNETREESSAAKKLAGDLTELSRSIIDEAREYAYSLTPKVVSEQGLQGALHWLADYAQAKFACECTLEFPRVWPDIAEPVAFALFQVAREAMHNAIRHGKATKIRVDILAKDDSWWQMEILDNGLGFSNESTAKGLGLQIMQVRLQEIGGNVRVRSSNQGTHILCQWPQHS